MNDIAIVGGGPAGALCGERLANHGFRVTIFDERLAWEKPCGGGLTHKAIEAYPFLLDGPQPKKIVRAAELISGGGHRARFEMSHPIVIYARKVLNGLLLDRAVAAGCTAVRSRVTRVDTRGAQVRLIACGEERYVDFVVLAAGARNQLLPETTALGAAFLAGWRAGVYPGPDEFARGWRVARRFTPAMPREEREERYRGWRDAVERDIAPARV